MTSRRILPPALPPTFTVRAALELGVSLHRLEAGDLRRPFHGIRTEVSAPESLEADCRALGTRFRQGDAFTGPTAARLWGMPLPSSWERPSLLFVSSRSPTRAMRREGVVASTRLTGDPLLRGGVWVMPVWETCLVLGRQLRPDDLTAVIDFVVTGELGRHPLSSLSRLDDFLEHSGRRPGLDSLRRARGVARRGAWSRPETHLRLLCLRAGLPEPLLNQ
ncbi:MAG: hypothetical protein M3N46_11030, partial [Actinomycetota bacterium]|nr:hypothetical protein [Actinomycetota bacterium]